MIFTRSKSLGLPCDSIHIFFLKWWKLVFCVKVQSIWIWSLWTQAAVALPLDHQSDYVWKRSAALVSGQQGENMSCYLNKILEILVGGYWKPLVLNNDHMLNSTFCLEQPYIKHHKKGKILLPTMYVCFPNISDCHLNIMLQKHILFT